MKKKPELTAVKRRDGRWAVRKRCGGYLAGDEKINYLVENKLVAAPAKKAAPEPVAAEESTEGAE